MNIKFQYVFLLLKSLQNPMTTVKNAKTELKIRLTKAIA